MKMLLTSRTPISFTQELSKMGVDKAHFNSPPSEHTFPTILKEDYLESWLYFLTTPSAKALSSLVKGNIETNFVLCSAYISHIHNIDSSPFNHATYSVTNTSFKRLEYTLNLIKPAFKEWAIRKNLIRNLGIDDLTVTVIEKDEDKTTNTFSNLSVRVELILKPYRKFSLVKSKIGTKSENTHLDAVLHGKLQNYLFRGTPPKELVGKSSHLERGKKRTRYIDKNIVRNYSDRQLFLVDDKLGVPVYMHRAGPYSMYTRMTFDLPNILMLGTTEFKRVERTITEILKKVITLK